MLGWRLNEPTLALSVCGDDREDFCWKTQCSVCAGGSQVDAKFVISEQSIEFDTPLVLFISLNEDAQVVEIL